MNVSTGLGDAIGRFLDLNTEQMKLTAGNMANIDTPGYKAQGFDFGEAFQSALTGGLAPRPTAVDGLVARPDGNNVSLDRESLEMAKAQLQFRTGVELLKHEYTRVLDAIHAEPR